MDELDPFLANLNPVVDYLYYQRGTITDFMVGAGAGHAASLPKFPGQPAPRHYLRVIPMNSAESLGLYGTRSASNRGSGYPKPFELTGEITASTGIFPNYDCKNIDYTPATSPGAPETATEEEFTDDDPQATGGFAPCVITRDSPSIFGGERYPQVFADP
jgi:hypothetical protein